MWESGGGRVRPHDFRNKRGAALVEFAIVALLLFTLVLGIIEFGMLLKDFLALNQATREGARSAALRSNYNTVVNRVLTSGPGLDPSRITVVRPSYRVYDSTSGTWGPWIENAVPPDSILTSNVQVRVHSEYKHKLITGSFFSWLAGGKDYLTVTSEMVMKRE